MVLKHPHFNFLTIVSLILVTSFQLFGQSSASQYDLQAEQLELTNNDYRNGKKLISEYYDLVYQGFEEGKPELFETAIRKVKQAKVLFGNAYTREKAHQNAHPANYHPPSLRDHQFWLSLADGLTTGNHIERLKGLAKHKEVEQSTREANSQKINTTNLNADEKRDVNNCSDFIRMGDCGTGCLKMKVCVVSETRNEITLQVEVFPTNINTCFGSTNNKPIKVFYGYEKTEVSRSSFKRGGYKTEPFTIPKEFDNGKTVWNSEYKVFKTSDGRYVYAPFFVVWC